MKTGRELVKLFMVICLGLLLVIPPVLAAPASKPEVIRWKGQSAYVGGASGGAGPYFAEWVKKATNGRLIIDVAPAGSIVPVSEMLKATSKGMLDFAGQYF